MRENGKFGQPLTNEEFLQMFSFQDLYDSVLKGGLLNWDPSVFIKIMPKEPRFEDTLDVVEKQLDGKSKGDDETDSSSHDIRYDRNKNDLGISRRYKEYVQCEARGIEEI